MYKIAKMKLISTIVSAKEKRDVPTTTEAQSTGANGTTTTSITTSITAGITTTTTTTTTATVETNGASALSASAGAQKPAFVAVVAALRSAAAAEKALKEKVRILKSDLCKEILLCWEVP